MNSKNSAQNSHPSATSDKPITLESISPTASGLTSPKNDPITSPIASEDAFLGLVNHYFPNNHSHLLLGRGDDCAELVCPPEMCMTSDLFLEDVHFRTSYFSYAEIGHKALAVNLSDIAACGAVPLGFNMNLILPAHTPANNVEAMLQGMAQLATQYNLPLTGGDLSQGQKLGICISVWGKQAGSKFLRRGACQPGDTIFLLAANEEKGGGADFPLGLARVGLLALEKWGRSEAQAQFPVACATHLTPRPLLAQGQALAKMLDATKNATPKISLMDLSDGLARDLPRLLGWQGNANDLGADINLSKADLPEELLRYCQQQGLNPQEQAMLGGEDYLLLGATSQPEILAKLENQVECKILSLGKVLAPPKQGIKLNGKPWQVKGFDHFCK